MILRSIFSRTDLLDHNSKYDNSAGNDVLHKAWHLQMVRPLARTARTAAPINVPTTQGTPLLDTVQPINTAA